MKSIFISSTFKDMQSERDAIHEQLIPRLRMNLREFFEDIHDIDLRWGVDTFRLTEEESSCEVLRVCVDAIDRNHPFMIVFLGERYGWIPDGFVFDKTEDNRLDGYKDQGLSVTNIEILYGAYRKLEMENCFFCFRNPDVLEKIEKKYVADYMSESSQHKELLDELKQKIVSDPSANVIHYSADWDTESHKICGLNNLMDQLHEKIMERIRDLLEEGKSRDRNLNIFLDANRTKENYLKTYVTRNLQEKYLLNLIRRRIDDSEYEKDVAFLRQEMGQHFTTEYIDRYVESWREYKKYNYFLTNYDMANPGSYMKLAVVCLRGESGSGKSAMMSWLQDQIQKEGKDTILYYSGNYDCQSIASLKRYLIYQLEEILDRRHENYDNMSNLDLEELSQELARKRKYVYCFIDSVDKLIEDYRYELDLFRYVPNMVYILSATQEYDLQKVIKSKNVILMEYPMESMNDAQKKKMVKNLSIQRGKSINEELLDCIVEKEESEYPIYVSMIMQRLFMMNREDFLQAQKIDVGINGLHQYIKDMIKALPRDMDQMVINLFEMISEIFQNNNLSFILKLLAITRYGLQEEEIEKIYEIAGFSFSMMKFQQMISFLYDFFEEGENGCWRFRHDIYKNAILNQISDSERELMLEWIFQCSLENEEFMLREGWELSLKYQHPKIHQILKRYCREKNDEIDMAVIKVLNEDKKYIEYFADNLREHMDGDLLSYWIHFTLNYEIYDSLLCALIREKSLKYLQETEDVYQKYYICRWIIKNASSDAAGYQEMLEYHNYALQVMETISDEEEKRYLRCRENKCWAEKQVLEQGNVVGAIDLLDEVIKSMGQNLEDYIEKAQSDYIFLYVEAFFLKYAYSSRRFKVTYLDELQEILSLLDRLEKIENLQKEALHYQSIIRREMAYELVGYQSNPGTAARNKATEIIEEAMEYSEAFVEKYYSFNALYEMADTYYWAQKVVHKDSSAYYAQKELDCYRQMRLIASKELCDSRIADILLSLALSMEDGYKMAMENISRAKFYLQKSISRQEKAESEAEKEYEKKLQVDIRNRLKKNQREVKTILLRRDEFIQESLELCNQFLEKNSRLLKLLTYVNKLYRLGVQDIRLGQSENAEMLFNRVIDICQQYGTYLKKDKKYKYLYRSHYEIAKLSVKQLEKTMEMRYYFQANEHIMKSIEFLKNMEPNGMSEESRKKIEKLVQFKDETLPEAMRKVLESMS